MFLGSLSPETHCICDPQAVSLDFLGVPGSALGCATLELISKHGFPADKRLGAGVVDGRSVWADGDAPTALLGSLVKQVLLTQQFVVRCSQITSKHTIALLLGFPVKQGQLCWPACTSCACLPLTTTAFRLCKWRTSLHAVAEADCQPMRTCCKCGIAGHH